MPKPTADDPRPIEAHKDEFGYVALMSDGEIEEMPTSNLLTVRRWARQYGCVVDPLKEGIYPIRPRKRK